MKYKYVGKVAINLKIPLQINNVKPGDEIDVPKNLVKYFHNEKIWQEVKGKKKRGEE